MQNDTILLASLMVMGLVAVVAGNYYILKSLYTITRMIEVLCETLREED